MASKSMAACCTGTAASTKATALTRFLPLPRSVLGSRQEGGTASERPSPSRMRAIRNSLLCSTFCDFHRLPTPLSCCAASSHNVSGGGPRNACRFFFVNFFWRVLHSTSARCSFSFETPAGLTLEVPLLPGLIKCCEDRHEQGLGRARRRLWPVREKILITLAAQRLEESSQPQRRKRDYRRKTSDVVCGYSKSLPSYYERHFEIHERGQYSA